jgi:LemA protein
MGLWVVVGGVAVLALVGIALYNGLVRRRVRCDEAWADIETQLKRRHDLVPNLVETVKGYAAHERGVLAEVVERRGRAMGAATPAQVAEAEGLLSQALGRLLAVAEAYPALRANENYLALQQALGEIEGALAASRGAYNGAVRDLNTRIDTVPANLVATWFGFRPREFFEIADPAERATPVVRF